MAGFECEIARQTMMLDTNVLVHGFRKRERYHRQARYFLDEYEKQFVIPVAVVVEAWGMLVGSNGDFGAGLAVLEWVNTPGKAVLLPQPADWLVDAQSLLAATRIDCVDVFIYQLALEISRQLAGGPAILVATYDTSDFYKCMQVQGVPIEIFDMRDLG
jgi:predicted nucleic acid-binding protein